MTYKHHLFWDDWNKEHIEKHQVTVDEVEEAYKSATICLTTYKDRMLILGITHNGRLLTIVCSQEKQKDLYVVSARDMSKKERKIYEQAKTNKTI